MSLLLSPEQLEIIKTYGTGPAKNYPAMYNYIATEMKAGRIANASSDQIYWFEQAAKINAGDVSSPASVFIRAATVAGLSSSGAPTDIAYIQKISNDIAEKVFADILNGGVIPEFKRQLNADISAAIRAGGMTIGGWGGAFYYWDAPYTKPDGTQTTVGDAIISNPAERTKFINGTLAATEATIKKFGIDGLVSDPAFWPALGTGLKNMLVSSPGFAYQLLIELKGEFTKYGPEAVQRLETEIRKLYGLSAALPAENTLSSLDPGNLLASNDDITSDSTSPLEENLYNLSQRTKAWETILQDYPGSSIATDGKGNYILVSSQGELIGQVFVESGMVYIGLLDGNKYSVTKDGTYSLEKPDGTSRTVTNGFDGVQVIKDFDENRQLLVRTETHKTPAGILVIDRFDGVGNKISTTELQTFDDGSRLETTTLPTGETTTKAYDTEGVLAGTMLDTPDGDGGYLRVVTTKVEGREVVIKQHAGADDLSGVADDAGDGDPLLITDPNDPDYMAQFDPNAGKYSSYEVRINGQVAVNNDLICKALDAQYGETTVTRDDGSIYTFGSGGLNLIEDSVGGSLAINSQLDGDTLTTLYTATGDLEQLINAGDAGVSNGYSNSIAPGTPSQKQTPWYQTPEAIAAADGLTITQGLMAALQSGKPLPILTSTFKLAAHINGNSNQTLTDINLGLGVVR